MAAAFVVASLSANAQVYLGGGVSFHSEDPGEGDTKTTINLIPELGYKLDDKLSIGVKLGLEHSKQGDKPLTTIHSSHTYATLSLNGTR